jgi:formate dehydrogenase subunit delta
MESNQLVKMANQISGFFKSYPDRDLARSEMLTHFKKFWAPKMIRELKSLLSNDNLIGLDDDVVEVFKMLEG